MNEQSRIYCTQIHVKLKKSHESYKEFTCGDVYAFVKCHDAKEALKKFSKELKNEHVIPTSFKFIDLFEDIKWEDNELVANLQQLADEASKTDEVVFDNLYCESRDA